MHSHSPSSERWHSSSRHQSLCFSASFAGRKTQKFHLGVKDLGPSANFMIRLWCTDCCGDGKHSCIERLLSMRMFLPEQGKLEECRICTVLLSTGHIYLYSTATITFSIERILPVITWGQISQKWFIRSGAISSLCVFKHKFHICVAEELIRDSNSSSSVQSQLPALSYTFIKSSCVDLTGENILSSQPKKIKWKHYSVQSKH